MPELFGICSESDLPPDGVLCFDRMRADLLSFRPGRTAVERLPSAAVGTVSHHVHDRAIMMRAEEDGTICAWIGTPTNRSDTKIELGRLIHQIVNGVYERLWILESRFAACIYDLDSRTTWIISDRFGHCPVYYAILNGSLVFSTKLFSLARCGALPPRLERSAVRALFAFEYVTGDKTIIEGIKLLAPATVLRFRRNSCNFTSYQRAIRHVSVAHRSRRDAADELYGCLYRSVGTVIRHHPRVLIPLSGGMDSRALLHCALEHAADIRTATFGVSGCRDVVYARQVAARAGIPHDVAETNGLFLREWLDYAVYVSGGMMSVNHIHIMALAHVLESEERVVLDGLSGDMLLGGHIKWWALQGRSTDAVIRRFLDLHARGWRSPVLRQLLQPCVAETLAQQAEDTVAQYLRNRSLGALWRRCSAFDLCERQRRFIQNGPMLIHPLAWVETPFYGSEVFECAARMTLPQLIEQRTYLSMYARHMRFLGAMPDSLREVPLTWPSAARFVKRVWDVTRRKMTRVFPEARDRLRVWTVDYENWYRIALRDWIRDRILDAPSTFFEFVRRDAAESILQEHEQGTANHATSLGCLVALAATCSAMQKTGIGVPNNSN